MVKLAKILLKTLKPFVTYLKFCIQKNTKFRACSKYGVKYGLQGQGSGRMPGFGSLLTDEQIKSIVEYVRGL